MQQFMANMVITGANEINSTALVEAATGRIAKYDSIVKSKSKITMEMGEFETLGETIVRMVLQKPAA
jgi:hypothetical protein